MFFVRRCAPVWHFTAVPLLAGAVLLHAINATAETTTQPASTATVTRTVDSSPAETKQADAAQALAKARIAALEKSLSGSALVGQFTEGKHAKAPQAERYELAAVKHLGNGQWLFKARIRYGDHDITLPLTLPILWAGDTPVITVDQLPVVGLGTFDARVMIYRNHYVGYWSGANHRGHLFGVVERAAEVKPRSSTNAAKDKPQDAQEPEPDAAANSAS